MAAAGKDLLLRIIIYGLFKIDYFIIQIFIYREIFVCFETLKRSNFALESCCEYCGENCLLNFEGNLVLAFGLNNSLKAENKSFDGQDIPLLFNMIDETISLMLPKLRFLKMIYHLFYCTSVIMSRSCQIVRYMVYNNILKF